MSTSENLTKVKTGKVRFSYAHVFEPTSMNEDGSNAKFSVSLIIPKSDKQTIAKIEKAIETALENGKEKMGGKIPKIWKNPLRDGDAEREDDPNYANSFFINANSNRKPGIVDANLDPIMDKDEFYSGCFGRATISFYPFNFNGTKGIAAGLGNLQKLEDGDRLGGAISSAEEDFADDDLL